MVERKQVPNLAERVAQEVLLDFILCTAFVRFGFTRRQRDAIVERDEVYGLRIPGNRGPCQANWRHKCNGDKHLHVHHRLPVGYCDRLGIDPNRYPTNGITLCENAHVAEDGIHPDTAEAKGKYRSGNKNAFKDMMTIRREKMDEGQAYWDDDPVKQRRMEAAAVRNTQKAEEHGWRWPFGRRKDE